jgi:hypothetical protein
MLLLQLLHIKGSYTSCSLLLYLLWLLLLWGPKSGYCILWLLYFQVRAFSGYSIFQF